MGLAAHQGNENRLRRVRASQAAEKLCFVSGHDFSRVPMNLRLTQGDENHSDFPIMILNGLDVVFDCAVND
jgi:hypothetical protein